MAFRDDDLPGRQQHLFTSLVLELSVPALKAHTRPAATDGLPMRC